MPKRENVVAQRVVTTPGAFSYSIIPKMHRSIHVVLVLPDPLFLFLVPRVSFLHRKVIILILIFK